MEPNMAENDQPNSWKRKKKRSFVQQVKKRFKKSPSFSRGTRFDAIEHEYFMRVFQLERIFEGTLEEKSVFANNALAQTEGREVHCSFNQLVSHVIENLLPLASNEVLEKYFEAFATNLRPTCVHEYASHVLQALLVVSARHSLEETSSESSHADKCKAWLLKVSTFLVNNIEEFMWDRYANRALRTAILCLAGMPQLDKHDKSDTNPTQTFDVPEQYLSLLDDFFTRISNWPQFKDFLKDSLSSGYLQCLLPALKSTRPKSYKSLRKIILSECFTEDDTSALFSPTALPVLEVMIDQSKGKLHKKIYNQLLAKHLVKLSTARVGNITVQKFINKCNNPEIIAEIVTVLAQYFHEIMACKTGAILSSLCQACERLKTAQTEFFQALTKALQVGEPQSLVPAVLSLSPPPYGPPNRLGSLVLQSLLKFQKPIKVVNSLLSYEPKDLAELLCSQYGSFVTGAFCTAEYIGEKNRYKLIQHLVGHYPYLAQSKFGSRSFDDIWEVAELKNKVQIVKDLDSGYSEVMTTQFGKFIASKVRLADFRALGIETWKKRLQSVQSRKELFAPIIGQVK